MKSKTYRTHRAAAVTITHKNNQQIGRLNDFKRQIRIFKLSLVRVIASPLYCIRTKFDNLLHGVKSWFPYFLSCFSFYLYFFLLVIVLHYFQTTSAEDASIRVYLEDKIPWLVLVCFELTWLMFVLPDVWTGKVTLWLCW